MEFLGKMWLDVLERSPEWPSKLGDGLSNPSEWPEPLSDSGAGKGS